MGAVITTIEVGDPQGRNFQSVEVEVDTGSTYTALPRGVLEALGVAVNKNRALTTRRRQSSKPVHSRTDCQHQAGGALNSSPPVIFAEEGEPSLLGVISLEDALLAVDPVNNELIPVVAKRY